MYVHVDHMDIEDEVQQLLEDYNDASDNNPTSDAQNVSDHDDDDPVAAENAAYCNSYMELIIM